MRQAHTVTKRGDRQTTTRHLGVTPGGEEVINMQAYTVEQVAEILNIGRDKVYALLRTKQLNSIKIGKLRRITDQHLADFVSSIEEMH